MVNKKLRSTVSFFTIRLLSNFYILYEYSKSQFYQVYLNREHSFLRRELQGYCMEDIL